MCPSVPFSVSLDINASSTDEEVVLFLGGRKVGDPVPGNMITEVSPFSIEPWDSPEDMWYLFNPEDPQSRNGDWETKVTGTGYWKSMDDRTILTSTPTVGRKTTREFYIGKAPHGDKTRWMMHEYRAWMMHEYRAEQKTHQEINIEQDFCNLCRVFLHIDERPSHEEQHNAIIAGAADDDYLDRVLLNLLEQDENNLSSRNAVSRSQMVGWDRQRQSVLSGTSVTGPETDRSAEDYATCDFSEGDYLELNDFYSLETSSSSSDNSSLMSENSDECFDADALLRDLENEPNPRVEEEHVDCRFSVSASVKSNQVVIRPPPPGSVCSNSSSNVVVEGGTFGNPMPERARTTSPSSSAYEQLSHNRKASTSGKSPGSHSDQSSSGSSCGSRTSQGQGSKTVGRIAKLGKKYYCCFRSFQPDLDS